METRKLYINGSWIVAESDRVIKVENPRPMRSSRAFRALATRT